MDSLIWILIIFFVVVPFINQIYKTGKTFQSRNSGSTIPNEKPAAVKNNLLPVVIILVLLGIGAALFFSGEIKNIGFLVTLIIIFSSIMSIIKNARKESGTSTETPSFFRLDPLQDQMTILRSLQATPHQRVEVIEQLQAKGDQTSRNLILRSAVYDPDVLVQNKAFQALSEMMGGPDKAEYAINAHKKGKPDDEPWFLSSGGLSNTQRRTFTSSYADQNIDPFQRTVLPAKWIMIFLLLGMMVALGVVFYFLATR